MLPWYNDRIIESTNDLLVEKNKSFCVFLVLLDLSTPLDDIDHDILITRVHDNRGLSGTAWMSSYLHGRS